MSALLKQLVSVGILAVLIGSIFFLRHAPASDRLSHDEAMRRYGFYLEEVSKDIGIDFTHQAPVLDHKLDRIMPLVAAMGAAVSIVDFDRDGLPDIYVINSAKGSKNALYRNMGDGTFKDVAEEMGIADLNQEGTGFCMGAVWGDYDNDGYEDLLVYKWGRPELFHNDKGKGFTRVTDKANLPKWLNANSAVWLDFDGDGKLDLFIAGYWRDDLDLSNLTTTHVMPESFEFAKNGGHKYLLRNMGDGTFKDVTEDMGIKSTRWTLAVAAGNLCGSRYPDIFLANDYGVSELYCNEDGKGFVEIGEKAGVAERPKSGMNASFGDIYNKGRFAVYVSNITEAKLLPQGNNLWVPLGEGAGAESHFVNLANPLGVELGGWSWGAQFGDLNNDGKIDLYLTNGYVSGNRDKDNYWYDYSLIAGANKEIIQDAAHWPSIGDRSLSGYQQKCLWLNTGGHFVDIAPAVGVTDTYDGRAVAMADLWNRGVLDVIVANQKGPLLVYKNTVTPDNKWIQFELQGTRSNRSAIGARVRVFWNGRQQLQEVSGGSGYASQNQRRLHFGLGKDPQIEKVVIDWPSGQTQIIDAPQAGILHKIEEPQ